MQDTQFEPDGLDQPTTAAAMVWGLWERCLISSRRADAMAKFFGSDLPNLPDAVQKLIADTRDILEKEGCSKRDSDSVLFDMYTRIHWDWNYATDKIYETLLEFELGEFFDERLVH